MLHRALLPALILILALVTVRPLDAARAVTLANGAITARFGDRGLESIADSTVGAPYRFTRDGFGVAIDGKTFDSDALPAPARTRAADRVTYAWTAGPYRLRVVYELQPGWRFVSKQIFIDTAPASRLHVDAVTVFQSSLGEPIESTFVPKSPRPSLGTGDYGIALRLAGARGLLAVAENPFLHAEHAGEAFTLSYEPDMDWSLDDGPFEADRGLLGPYRLTGRTIPAVMQPEWTMTRTDTTPGMDEAEVDAFTRMVRAFLLVKADKPIDVFVGWTANDYQIDVGTPEGRAEYKRVLDRAAGVGAEYVLYAPSDSALSRREDSVDDWSWEHVLWFGLGQKIRKGEWDPRTSPVPPSVQEMLDYARSKHLGLLAYVYPVLPFSQNPAWLVPGRRPDRQNASLGFRSLQDWLIDELVAFHDRLGIAGYAFDHTFLNYKGPSFYAQWWGWRRVMETLRRRIPDIVIDGRQAYQMYGPWSWLAGSYPHPTSTDEQPESFVPFPDLHFDRVSADRERYTAWWYRNHEFAPSEIVPGYMTHQTSRSDETDDMPSTRTKDRGVVLDRFRARDWDDLGWRYSVISSIAVGGWNNVIDMIPARDLAEDRAFSAEDQAWWRRWLDWTVTNKELLRHTRTILGQPALGKVDGTSAMAGDHGFVFLFNPNARRLPADFALDETIGLAPGGRPGGSPLPASRFLIKEIYPAESRLVGKPGAGVWTAGDRVSITMDGESALVLEISPAPQAPAVPVLFNAPGTASLDGGVLTLTGVRGEVGTSADLEVQVPEGAAEATAVRVNGVEVAFTRPAANLITATVRFAGAPFRHAQQAGTYDPRFVGGTLRGTFTIPGRIFDQLRARQRAWPIPWTSEDYRTTWLAPQRLLLYVQIAEPDDRWEASLTIDGRLVELTKAYTAVRVYRRTFVGFYADVSLLDADREHTFELTLPALEPGQFQGLFFENVETEYTDSIMR